MITVGVVSAHGMGESDALSDCVAGYEIGRGPACGVRRRWSAATLHHVPTEAELAAIRRSSETGLPFGQRRWAARLCQELGLDLTTSKPACRREKCTTNKKIVPCLGKKAQQVTASTAHPMNGLIISRLPPLDFHNPAAARSSKRPGDARRPIAAGEIEASPAVAAYVGQNESGWRGAVPVGG